MPTRPSAPFLEEARLIVASLAGDSLVSKVAELLAQNALQQERLGGWEDSLKILLDGDACAAHSQMVKSINFSDFMTLNKNIGCRYCAYVKLQATC
jgi:hypothetical protein